MGVQPFDIIPLRIEGSEGKRGFPVNVSIQLGSFHISRKYADDCRRKSEVKLPAIWTDEKQRWEEAERREE